MLPLFAKAVVLAATVTVIAGQSAAAATPAGSLAATGCLPDGQTIYKSMTKRTVRSLAGGSGVRVWSGRRAEIRSYPTCSAQQSVLVGFRKKRVRSVEVRTLLKAQDTDGDGVPEYFFDTNADGTFESMAADTNHNGYYETYFVRGTSSAILFGDSNENGYVEYAAVDIDNSGRAAWVIWDQNEDGVAELMEVDLIGNDGVADSWVSATSPSTYTPPGLSSQQARQANDMMVRHIVTMQQLRQFDPWDVNWYVPNGLTPSLLLPGTSPYRQCGAMCTL